MKETLTERVLNNLQYIILELTIHKDKIINEEIRGKMLKLIQQNKEFLITNERMDTYERGNVDLRDCDEGDILISALGGVLKYIRPTEEDNYYDHHVEYLDGDLGDGTRTHDGYVFRKNRKPETDHDIVRIIKV